jgi:hypothetical protein
LATTYDSARERELFHRLNAYREANNLPPLAWNDDLARAGRFHAADMAATDYVSHDSYNCAATTIPGTPPCAITCTMSNRNGAFYSGWTALAENIAINQSTAAQAQTALQNSPSHDANMRSADVREVGIGYTPNSLAPLNMHLWVQVFGANGSVFPLLINQDSLQTTSTQVRLYMYRPNTTYDEMRLSNDQNTWTAWQAFPANHRTTWTLSSGNGQKNVYVQLRRSSNPTQAIQLLQDQITLSAQPVARGTAAMPATVCIFPHPATSYLQGQLDLPGTHTLILRDLLGRPVLQQAVQAGTFALPVDHLPRGAYLLQLGTHTQRVVLQ